MSERSYDAETIENALKSVAEPCRVLYSFDILATKMTDVDDKAEYFWSCAMGYLKLERLDDIQKKAL